MARRGKRRGTPTPAGEVLDKVLQRVGKGEAAVRFRLVALWRSWEAVVGPEIASLAGVVPGENALGLALSEIEVRVSSHPWVAAASVRRELPAGVAITVEEREPAWWVRTADGLAYADASGRVIAPVAAEGLTPLPLLALGSGAAGDLDDLTGRLRALEAPGLPAPVADAALVRVDGRRVQIAWDRPPLALDLGLEGDGAGWELTAGRLTRLLGDLAGRGESAAVRRVTLRGDKAWVALE